jgi:8-oxo-dGTP pyrophosphatase MutT (NUDIX family)
MTLPRLSLPTNPDVPASVRKMAAVALIAGPDGELLFIRRAAREGDPWSGDMAFPGGRAQASDASLVATAMRETMEEVGLDLRDAHYLGALPCHVSPVRDPDGTFGIFPFVFEVGAWPELTPNEEVAAVHRFAMERLFAGEGRGEFRYQRGGYDVLLPCVRIDGSFIWGLTLRMLDELHARASGGDAPQPFPPAGARG